MAKGQLAGSRGMRLENLRYWDGGAQRLT